MGSRNRFIKREQAPFKMQAPAQVRSRAENRRSTSGTKSTPVIPSMMTPGETYGDPTPTIQPGGRPRGPMFMDPVGPAREMPGASSFMDPVAPKDADVTQLVNTPGRQILPTETSGKNALGVQQSGRSLSGGVSAAFVPEYANSSFNQLLAGVNTSGYQPFSSNQLPTSGASLDSKMSPMTQAITNIGPVADGQQYANNLGRQGTKGIGPVADGQVYGNVLENAPNAGTKGIGPLADGQAYAQSLGKGGGISSRMDAALNDTAGINSYMSKFSSGDQERAANRAFLDTKGSMEGLRAKEAVNGVVYAGGQHYVAGKSGDDKAVAIDRSAARDISNGNETSAGASQKAQDFLAKKAADTVAAIKQAPAVLEQGAKDGAFQQDKPMFSGSTPAIEGAVEFDNNNDKTLPTYGNNGGYKSGFKKIDTSMPNPFG